MNADKLQVENKSSHHYRLLYHGDKTLCLFSLAII